MWTVFIVGVFAVVQSLFGVGLLVFGTPTLLLLGYSFANALAILLPASITVSLLQAWKSGGQDVAFIRSFACWCLVPLAVSLAAVLLLDLHASLNLFVAILLAVFVILRLYPGLGQQAREWVARHDRTWLVLTGAVHGVSNLGGALLLIFAASRFRRKEDIRALIAFCYACFAAIQLTVLAVFTPSAFGWSQVGYGAVAAIVFLLVGQRVFRWVSAPAFDWLLALVAGAYAGLLGLRSAGVF
ncbi:MAG: hypothetical protein EXQ50_10865 [Acidobacteria bacterium]|nr:hypothetical protein [Acidobacteriota bacterium]